MGSLTPEDLRRAWTHGFEDPKFFCEFFLSGWFRRPLQWFHYGLLAILTRKVSWLEQLSDRDLDKILRHFVWKENPEDERSPEQPIFFWEKEGEPACRVLKMVLRSYTLVMVPRGFGKTTIVNAANLYAICYRECKIPLYVSESGRHAETQLRNVKTELEFNVLLREVFGELRPPQRSGYKWTEDVAECLNGVTLIARGRGAQIRGLLISGYRPDRVVVDDVEDEESVRTDDQRAKVRDWAYGSLMPALDDISEQSEASIVAIGTLLDADSLLMTWRKDPQFNTVVLECVDRDGEPLWNDKMSLEDIDKKKQSYALAGLLGRFYLEYHNALRVGELAKFRREYIIYKPGEAIREMRKGLAIDPAISERKESDFCSFACDAMDAKGVHHILEVYMERGMSPRDQIDKFFELSKLFWPVQRHGVEAIAYQRALIHLLQEEMYARNHFFEITPILHGQIGKVERVEGILQPRYANGYIVHARRFPLYESQLLDWPRGKKDGPDVVAMAVGLCDPFAFQALGRGKDSGVMRALGPVDEAIGGEWRRAV